MDLHLKRSGVSQGNLFESPVVLPDFKSNLLVTTEEAYEIYEDAWIDEWYPDRAKHDECFTKGKKAVSHLLAAYRETPLDIAFVEKGFTLVLGQHSVKGKIDRIDKCADGTFAIYDYKTGEAKTELDADAKEQLYIYQVALEELGMKVSKLAYIYALDWVVTEAPLLAEKKRDAFIEKLTDRMDAILVSDYAPTPQSFVCKFCDFRNICEFKK
jgi:DNA helicase-2/ATP-dependent DNA helicase PcrA